MIGRHLILAAATAMPMTVAAQERAGQFDTPSTLVPRNVVSARIGQCVVKRDRKKAAAYVVVHNGDPKFKKVLADIMPAMESCLAGSRSATLDPSYLRGGIAEGLLQADSGALLDAAAAQKAVSPVRMRLADTNEPVVSAMACATGAQPGDAVAMLRNPPESVAEATAFQALEPSLQACAPATGELRFNPARVRPAVAIALYRRVVGQ